jgi:hypothetical protein
MNIDFKKVTNQNMLNPADLRVNAHHPSLSGHNNDFNQYSGRGKNPRGSMT